MPACATDRPFKKLGRRAIGGRPVDLAMSVARRRAREGKKLNLLIAELQHRSRNLLGLVDILAERTAMDSERLEDFVPAFRARLMVLGRAQAFVSPAPGQRPPALEELLALEMEAASGLSPVRGHPHVRLAGPAGVMLDRETAQMAALAFHELATNSAKYGVLGSRPGELDIHWSTAREGAEGWLRIEWCETGLPEIRPAKAARGFGRELIEQGLPQQFGARTRYRIGRDSIHCVIELRHDIPTTGARQPHV